MITTAHAIFYLRGKLLHRQEYRVASDVQRAMKNQQACGELLCSTQE